MRSATSDVIFLLVTLAVLIATSSNGQPLFVDVSENTGICVDHGHGISLADYDQDGFLDVYCTDKFGPSRLFRNNGNFTFTDVTFQAGLHIPIKSESSTWIDYDNDGDLDLFVACYNCPNKLFRNAKGIFVDVAVQAGLKLEYKGSYQGAWSDFDRDGFVDLYVVNFEVGEENRLYRNNGDGSFTDITPLAMVDGLPFEKSRAAAWCDFNNDGWPDLFVNNQGIDVLYYNLGNRTFCDETDNFGLYNIGNGYGCSWKDVDNDGLFDLTIANKYNPLNLFLNGRLCFDSGNSLFYPEIPDISISVAWADIDNDSFLDLYVTNTPELGHKEYLFKSSSANQLCDIITESGVESGITGHSAVWGDLDNDGDLDLLVSAHQLEDLYVYENKLEAIEPENNWLEIDIIGTRSNRSAIGARARIYAGGAIQVREKTCGDNYKSQDSPIIHFGLGRATVVDSLIVKWPSGIIQVMTNVESNQLLTIVEHANVGVEEEEKKYPARFALEPNYPNPFNPTTTISYTVAMGCDVKIVVQNSGGRIVDVLVDRRMAPGNYSVVWDASKFSTGAYFCTMYAGAFRMVRKMLLLK